jgi:hypothetical protein
MKFRRHFFLALLFNALHALYAQDASFFKENLTFKIEGDYFKVEGEYYLRKLTDTTDRIILFYPFPTDSFFAPVDSLFIFDMGRTKPIPVLKQSVKGAFFSLELDSVNVILIAYRQKMLGNQARYILTTTSYWGRAFEQAGYTLITPASLEVTSFSYAPDGRQVIGNEIVYSWRKYNFMPDRDMIFTFEENSANKVGNEK